MLPTLSVTVTVLFVTAVGGTVKVIDESVPEVTVVLDVEITPVAPLKVAVTVLPVGPKPVPLIVTDVPFGPSEVLSEIDGVIVNVVIAVMVGDTLVSVTVSTYVPAKSVVGTVNEVASV